MVHYVWIPIVAAITFAIVALIADDEQKKVKTIVSLFAIGVSLILAGLFLVSFVLSQEATHSLLTWAGVALVALGTLICALVGPNIKKLELYVENDDDEDYDDEEDNEEDEVEEGESQEEKDEAKPGPAGNNPAN